MGSIVKVNATVISAPMPPSLQQTGAIISQGATIIAPGTFTFLSGTPTLATILQGSKAVTSITQTGGVATLTATAAHGIATGASAPITVAGAAVTAYNGTFLATSTGATTLTYAVPSGTATPAAGTISYTLEDVAELSAAVTNFFAMGSQVGVYVLELGVGNATDGANALAAYIAANPNTNYTPGATGFFYAYCVPRGWASSAAFLALVAAYESPNAQTYFFTTANLANYANFTVAMKGAFVTVELPATGTWPSNSLVSIAYSGAWATNALTAITWAGGLVTATTTSAHGVLEGQSFTTIGCTPAGYNGTFTALPGTTGSTLVYALTVNPGAESVLGSLAASQFGTVTATTTTNHGVAVGQWFQIVGVLPVGYDGWWLAGVGTTGATLVYSVATALGAESQLGTLLVSTYALSGPSASEFDSAACMQALLSQNPAPNNLMRPFSYRFLFGVTPWPATAFPDTQKALASANVNIAATGAEGGISNNILEYGTTMDGNDFSFWYSVDWFSINAQVDLAAAVIDGSNNPLAPLDYSQLGINTLQSVLTSLAALAVSLRIAQGQVVSTQLDSATFAQNFANGDYDGNVVINAVPFTTYATQNPSDYQIGNYAGFTVAFTPVRGFRTILVNLEAVEFA